jgi:hypothetical protein
MDYKITAKLFETTYANVFNWVKKYREKGEDGLGDKRGCRKDDEKVDEVTLLKRQLKQKDTNLKWYNWNLSFLDLYDRIVVGYEVGDHNNNILVFNTFDNAVKDNPNARPLFHSGRGF